MDEEKKATEEEAVQTSNAPADDLQKAAEEVIEKVRNQALVKGASMICGAALGIMRKHLSKEGKTSLRDYKRMADELFHFFEVPIQKDKELYGTIQNDSNEEKEASQE